jgi:hypothetical protein
VITANTSVNRIEMRISLGSDFNICLAIS